jgi:hypothetical protein
MQVLALHLGWNLGGEKAVEERPVALEGDTEIFSGHLVAAIPLTFQALPFPGEGIGEPLHEVRDERVCFFDRVPGLIDKAGLNRLPTAAHIRRCVLIEKRFTLP